MAETWFGAGFVCAREVDLDTLLKAIRQRLGEAEGMPEAAECPDGLPILDPDLRLERDVVKGVSPLLVGAPFPGRAVWAVVPPVYDVHEPDPFPLTAAALHDAFPGLCAFVATYSGSTGIERTIDATGEAEDDGSDGPEGAKVLLANVARQLDVTPEALIEVLARFDGRKDTVHVALDETDAGRLRDQAKAVVAAMGPDPKVVTVVPDAGLPETPEPEPEPASAAPADPVVVAPDEAKLAAERATAQQLKLLAVMGAALLALMIVFAIMAAKDPTVYGRH